MQAAQKAFILLWTATAIVVIALMVLLYVSLIPHFGEIGDAMIWVVRIALACGTILMLTFTYSWVGRLLSKRKRDQLHERLVVHGEVAAYIMPDGTFEHLSAKHIAAGVPRMLPAPKDEKLVMDDETIVEMYKDGATLMQIVEAGKPVDLKYNRVQSVVAAAKKRGDVL